MSNNFKVVILTMFDSHDFPNKAMSDIHGKPMLQHVFESAKESGASEVVVATDSPKIGMAAEGFGADVCMLMDEESKGINRLAEVADKMTWGDETIIINLPADAPLTPSSIIEQVADNLNSQANADCAILYSVVSREEIENKHTVSLVVDHEDYAMYFSHQPLPFESSDTDRVSDYKCYAEVNAYRAGLLRGCRNMPESELEIIEDIEALKLLYNGIKIHAEEANAVIGQRVITEANLDKVKFLIAPNRQ